MSDTTPATPDEPETTICDRCAQEVEVAETQPGPPGEWEGCNLCNECYAEELP